MDMSKNKMQYISSMAVTGMDISAGLRSQSKMPNGTKNRKPNIRKPLRQPNI